MRQIPLALALASEPDFDSFVAGANRVALDSLLALTPLSESAAPVYLHGPPGSGKTHLLAALTHRLQEQGGRAGWFDAAQSLPWDFDEHWSLIVIDGAERLDPPRQHAAFGLFVDAATHGVLIAGAGRLPPVDLPLREDLRSRFGWGLVFGLQPLSEPDSRAALAREALRRGLNLPDEVLNFLLTRYPRELGSLMAMLDRLDRYALAEGRSLTVPLLKEMVAEDGPQQ